jgi:DNA adenine methylase
MRSPLKRHGGKYYLAPKIVELLLPRLKGVYVEPFFGTGAVMLAMPHQGEGVCEVVNDLEQDLAIFWRAMASEEAFRLLVRTAQATPFSESLWRVADRLLAVPAPPWDDDFWERRPAALANRAYWYFVHVRQSLGGAGNAFAPVSTSRLRQGFCEQAAAWTSCVAGLRQVHERLVRAFVHCRPALEIVEKYDGENAVMYLDPPYPLATRKGGGYRHEMTMGEHMELLDALIRCKAKIAISSYPNTTYQVKLSQWNMHQWNLPNNVSHSPTKGRETEVLYTNF